MATKVFVGNLAFATTTETLKEQFSAAGEVLNANIITRGPRSLGYGFVELASPEAAEQAVKLLHHKDLDGRTINVEVARPRAEGEDNRPAGEGEEGERPRRRRQRKPRTEGAEGDVGTSGGDNGSPSSKPTGGRGGRRRYSRQDQEGASGEEQPRRFRRAPAGEGADAQVQGEGGARRGGRGRGGRAATGARTTFQPKGYRAKVGTNGEAGQAGGNEANPSSPSTSAPRTRRPRQPKQQPVKRQEDRLPSDTTLFVANLPFATTDEQLKALFSTAAPVASAHVVTRKNGKSKGFGFVEFATKEHQEAALKATDGSEVEGRKLNVKVALKAPPTDGAGASGAASDAATPAAGPSDAAEPAKTDAKPADAGDKEKDKATA